MASFQDGRRCENVLPSQLTLPAFRPKAHYFKRPNRYESSCSTKPRKRICDRPNGSIPGGYGLACHTDRRSHRVERCGIRGLFETRGGCYCPSLRWQMTGNWRWSPRKPRSIAVLEGINQDSVRESSCPHTPVPAEISRSPAPCRSLEENRFRPNAGPPLPRESLPGGADAPWRRSNRDRCSTPGS